MADVSVEFGAQDTGLEQTLKTIQDQLVELDGELKSGTLSFDEINKKMREAAQAEKLHQSLGGTKDQVEALNLSFKQTKPEVEKFTENQKEAAQETQKASTSFKTMAGEMFELRAALENGNLSADEFDKTLRRLNRLEDIQKKMDAFKQSTTDAGESADQATPEVEELGTDIKKTGNEAEDFGEKSKGGFLKMSGAVAAGQLAAEAAMAGIKAAINLAKGAVDEFAAALDLGGRLSDLAARTGEAEGNLLLLERAFQNSGAGAEQVGPAINKLQKFMEDAAQGGATQTQAMEDLGLSFTDLQGKTPIEQMQIFADRISAIEDPGKRAALAMDVFGRSGGELLPFLTNFSGEIGTAEDQLGGMVDIMNRNAATFDAVSDKVNIAKGKFTDFAAGILDRVIPALDAITEGLSRIDAAKIGQELADAFLGGESAMNGFQAAVDAFKTGKIREALEILWDSIVLQAEQTANEIFRNLEAAFKTSGDVLAEIFRSDGPAANLMKQTFSGIASFIEEKLYNALADFMGAIGRLQMEEVFRYKAETAAREVERALDSIPIYAELVAEDAGEQLAKSPELFKKNLAESEGIFTDLNEKAAALKAKQDEITAAVTKTNEEKGKGAPVDEEAIKRAEEQRRLAAEAAAEKSKMEGLQNALNAAIASGNELEQQTIEKMIEAEEAKKRIKQLTDQYIATGLGEKEAGQLATNLVNSEIAAKRVAQTAKDTKTNFDDAGNSVNTIKKEVERLYETPMDKPAKGFKEEVNLAREQLFKLQRFIGEDLSRMSLSDIVKKLGLDTPGLSNSNEKLRDIKQFITDLGNEDPANVTPEVDVPGSKDNIAKIKEALKETEGTDATPKIDQEKVKEQASAARKTVEDDLKKVEATVTVKPKLDKEALQDEVDMAFASSKGTEYLGDIKGFVEVIKGFVEKIEGKLPLQALAY